MKNVLVFSAGGRRDDDCCDVCRQTQSSDVSRIDAYYLPRALYIVHLAPLYASDCVRTSKGIRLYLGHSLHSVDLVMLS